MKQLKQIIQEKLKIGSKTRVKSYKYYPKNETELSSIIKELIENEGSDANLNIIDTSQITNMSAIFSGCKPEGVGKIKIDDWDVSNVKNMRNMFLRCENFDCDLSKWDVSKVQDMSGMFYKCKKFNQDISKWDVSRVETMEDMFNGCHEFNQDISKWDVSKVISMERMFSACHSFNQNLDSWKIKEDCDTESAFNFCRSLKKIPKWYVYEED